MKKSKRFVLVILFCGFVFSQVSFPCFAGNDALPWEEVQYTPTIFTKEITDYTTNLKVYVYDNTTLYIKNGTETIFEKYYKKEGIKKVRISEQNQGTMLEFYLVSDSSQKKGDTIQRKVVSITESVKEIQNFEIPVPEVIGKVTNRTRKFWVRGKKGFTLVMKNGKGDTIKRMVFSKEKEVIRILRQEGEHLYCYLTDGNKRSPIVPVKIYDTTVPKTPKIWINSEKMTVKGEIGNSVYLKAGNGKWIREGVIVNEQGFHIFISVYGKQDEYKVKLRDLSGNESKVKKQKNLQEEVMEIVSLD